MSEPEFGTLCDKCQVKLEAHSDPELEAAWEGHKAWHRTKDAQALEDAGLTPAVAPMPEAANEGLQAIYKNEKDHENDIARYYEAVSKIEHKLPRLIDFGFKLANVMGNICKQRGWRTKSLKHGNILWVPGGEIALEMRYDPYDISAPSEIEYLKKGYARLPKLQADYPAIFEAVMTLGHHLTSMMHSQRLNQKDLTFTNLHHFVNPNNNIDHLAFKIVNRRHVLKAGAVKL